MEAPTTTRRVAASARASSFPSARMLEAQRTFQSVVKQELQMLLGSGTKREEAVKLLLRRIVASTEPPEAAAVRGVMRQFQMNYDDAVRALIVKQELGRLKRQGLDSFAAIEELTRKMRSREEIEQEEEQVEQQVEHKDSLVEEKNEQVSTQEQEKEAIPAAEMASPTSEKDGNETSLSLIQRIGQVSISSGNTPEREKEEHEEEKETNEDTDGEENESVGKQNKTLFKSPLRVRSPNSNNLADLTPQSRKRRAAFGAQYDTGSNSSGRSVKPLFPSLKKQKLCAEVGDGFLEVVTRKSKQTSPSVSKPTTTGSSGSSPNSGKGGGGSRGDHSSKNVHKRQRVSPTGMQDEDESPIAEELRVSHVHHRHHTHHSKRQKSGSH
ncbi:hypothetical protein PC129_g20866 [Phytophthora cactorum]|uniref:Uncharacterized protein n=1 Tax=Phytophthora cactorum TaxID=29920 RepID=A0A329SAA0_9STRA|nr:hypothetical protein Pcac1_g11486 [Phytophthora cactorum]KAG2803520.1 hypothetical protein PC112_g19140 [Phytophthora cactorum]KAG2824622.1 hypothetical protein PC111_g9747 [Phytophthora cactorum]KAG2858288.1 hypothetical protein PC113_g9959 [Phytophthora cactorum]KAG2892448.1 hypothetical protein PC115_g18818 [Phytophthora cactorum]